jgi:hypothetical protein
MERCFSLLIGWCWFATASHWLGVGGCKDEIEPWPITGVASDSTLVERYRL